MKFAIVWLIGMAICCGQDFASTAGQFLQNVLPNLITNQIKNQYQEHLAKGTFERPDFVAGGAAKTSYEDLLRQVQDQISDEDLLRLSEEIFNADTNSVYNYIQVNLQGKTTPTSKNDEAPFNLLYVPAQVWNGLTIKPFVDLFHNYHKNIIVPEFFTENEESEQTTYLNTILGTGPIRTLMAYLVDKGLKQLQEHNAQRGLLKKIWFTKYARHWSGFCKCSSAFENIFMAEFNGDEVLGLRSWLFFAIREQYRKANYLGHIDKLDLAEKGIILRHHSIISSTKDAPMVKMFIGTSPELETALYTLCFMARPNRPCELRFKNITFDIKTTTIRAENTILIDTACPGF